ncbi:MAG TPA: hypothetical protein VIG95_02295 [Gemmatimonadales bacterium]
MEDRLAAFEAAPLPGRDCRAQFHLDAGDSKATRLVAGDTSYDPGAKGFNVDVGPDQATHQRGRETVTYNGAENHCCIRALAIAYRWSLIEEQGWRATDLGELRRESIPADEPKVDLVRMEV